MLDRDEVKDVDSVDLVGADTVELGGTVNVEVEDANNVELEDVDIVELELEVVDCGLTELKGVDDTRGGLDSFVDNVVGVLGVGGLGRVNEDVLEDCKDVLDC